MAAFGQVAGAGEEAHSETARMGRKGELKI